MVTRNRFLVSAIYYVVKKITKSVNLHQTDAGLAVLQEKLNMYRFHNGPISREMTGPNYFGSTLPDQLYFAAKMLRIRSN